LVFQASTENTTVTLDETGLGPDKDIQCNLANIPFVGKRTTSLLIEGIRADKALKFSGNQAAFSDPYGKVTIKQSNIQFVDKDVQSFFYKTPVDIINDSSVTVQEGGMFTISANLRIKKSILKFEKAIRIGAHITLHRADEELIDSAPDLPNPENGDS
jgi:hypothetical protein